LRIGCSGWQYKHWKGDFYPATLPPARWLEYYATHFDTVEINNSFYRLPEAGTFAQWRRRVPSSFVYAVKASRYLTHLKKLKDPGPPVQLFFSRARSLGPRLGPVLYQLPPRWPRNLERLETFLRTLPARRLHAIEFRDPSWYCDGTFELLQRHKVALCAHDMEGSATGQRSVGPFVYLRLHGPQRYSGRYPDLALEAWAEWCVAQRQGSGVYVYFNNDSGGHAPRDAMRLRDLCEKAAGRIASAR
jgi:uncharacterized protein YecE (DUF72 family)